LEGRFDVEKSTFISEKIERRKKKEKRKKKE